MAEKAPVRVLISGAAGQIGYSLIPLFANGLVLGQDQPIILNLLEIPPAMDALRGVAMEITDGAYPLVKGMVLTADYDEAFTDVDFCVLVGGFPRKKGMLRSDLMAKNAPIFRAAGEALERVGKVTTKVLVVANPANTNCLTCATFAPKIPKTNFCALTRLDQNRAMAQVAQKLDVPVSSVKNVVIWGNHSKTQVPDVNNGIVKTEEKEDQLSGLLENEWVRGEFTTTVQQRGKAIIDARGLSSAMSAANAAKDCLRDWVRGTAPNEYVAMSIWQDGTKYGIAEGIYYSMPCTCAGGEFTVVEGLNVTDDVQALMQATQNELLEEREEALGGTASS